MNEVPHDEHDDQNHRSLAYPDYGDGGSGNGGGDDVDLIDLKLTGDLQKDFDALTSSLAEHLKRTGNKNFDDVDIRELLETKGELPPVIKSLTPPLPSTTTMTTVAPKKSAPSEGGGIKFDRFLNFGNSASGSSRAGGAQTTASASSRKSTGWRDQGGDEVRQEEENSESVTLCKLMNICDAPKKQGEQINSNKRPKAYFGDTIAMGSETHRSVVDPPLDLLFPLRARRLTRKRRKKKLNLRTGEKTAVEVAQLLSGGGGNKHEEGLRSSPSSELQRKRGDLGVDAGRAKATLVESEDEDALQHIDSEKEGEEFTVGEHNIDRDDSSWTPVLFQSPLLDSSTPSSSQSLSDSEDGWKPIGEPVTKQRD